MRSGNTDDRPLSDADGSFVRHAEMQTRRLACVSMPEIAASRYSELDRMTIGGSRVAFPYEIAPSGSASAASTGRRATTKEAMTTVRRIILIIILIFVVYSIVVNPTVAATDVRTAIAWVIAGIQQIFTFFSKVATG